MTSISNIWKQLTSNFSNLNNFHSLEVVDRVSETQLQVGENSDWRIWRSKGWMTRWVVSEHSLSSWNTSWRVDPMLAEWWGTVADGGLSLHHHLFGISRCLILWVFYVLIVAGLREYCVAVAAVTAVWATQQDHILCVWWLSLAAL